MSTTNATANRTVTFIASVDLKGDDGTWGGVHEKDWDKVMQWFIGLNDGIIEEVQNLRLDLVEPGRVRFTYEVDASVHLDEDDVNNSMLADPDDDCNYPITLEDEEGEPAQYIVIGSVEGQTW